MRESAHARAGAQRGGGGAALHARRRERRRRAPCGRRSCGAGRPRERPRTWPARPPAWRTRGTSGSAARPKSSARQTPAASCSAPRHTRKRLAAVRERAATHPYERVAGVMHVARAHRERITQPTRQRFRLASPNARHGAKAPHQGSSPAQAQLVGGACYAIRTAPRTEVRAARWRRDCTAEFNAGVAHTAARLVPGASNRRARASGAARCLRARCRVRQLPVSAALGRDVSARRSLRVCCAARGGAAALGL